MNKLTQYLVEGILGKSTEGVIILFPGGFKPATGGHLSLVKRYASQPNVSEVNIMIGPGERDGITRDQSIAVWKKLLIGVANVKVTKSNEVTPITAAYKYIETAKPGTYALASSSKGKDYDRVLKFIAGHAKDGKYKRKGVAVVEMAIDTAPALYKGRKDDFNGKGISASILRKDLANRNFNNFKTNYPETSIETVKSIYGLLTKKPIAESVLLLNEGGGAGHLAHPYEDYDLTFSDIANMIDAALGGTVEAAQEKLDGQNLMVTYKDGKIRGARNKGHLKDFAANSLTVAQVKQTFAGRGPIQAAFTEAMVDLESAIAALSPKQKEKFFANGSKFLNLEVLYPETANVVPYGATQLRIHHIKEYDKAGNVIGEDIQAAREFEGALRQVEAQNQKTYEIKITDPVTIRKSADFVKQKEELLKILKDVVGKRALKMDDKLGLYFQAWWKEYITNTGKQYGYNIEDTVLQQLINRWAFGNKETNIKVIRDGITNEDFKTWAIEFDKRDYAMQNKIAASPIENLFLKLGVYTLSNIENLVSLNPNNSVRQMKKDLKSAVNQIKVSGKTDANALDFLKRELTRLKDIGGYNAILPTEGIVFKYNGKLFKLTGAFAPINQLIGYMKFG